MTCTEVRERLPEYVVGWLEEDERRALEEHLEQCPSCREEARAYHETTAVLASLVPQVAPRPQLKAQTLSRLHRRPLRPWPRAWMYRAAWMALAILMAVLLFNNWRLWTRVQALQTTPAATPTSAFRLVLLYGTQHMPQAQGALLLVPQETEAVLVVKNLPPPEPGWAYQLWLIRPGGQRVSGAVFSVPSAWDWTVVEVLSPEPLAHFQAFGVTLEPEGGSPQPTGPRLLGSR